MNARERERQKISPFCNFLIWHKLTKLGGRQAAGAAMAASAGSAAMTGGAAGPAPAKYDLMEARRVSCRDAPFSFPNGDLLRETQIRTDFVSKYDEGDK